MRLFASRLFAPRLFAARLFARAARAVFALAARHGGTVYAAAVPVARRGARAAVFAAAAETLRRKSPPRIMRARPARVAL